MKTIIKTQSHQGKCRRKIPIKITPKMIDPAEFEDGLSVIHLYASSFVQKESFFI